MCSNCNIKDITFHIFDTLGNCSSSRYVYLVGIIPKIVVETEVKVC